jgi:hypothetical protein
VADFRKYFTAIKIGGSPKERLNTAAEEKADLGVTSPKRYLILLIPLIGGIWAMVGNHLVALRERTILGTVVEHQADNRSTSIYSFSVDSKVYTGQELGSKHKAIGEQVTVYYDPADPERNRLNDFDEEALGLLGLVSFMLILYGIGIFFILHQRRHLIQRRNVPRNIASQT